MSFTLSNGSVLSIATVYVAAKTFTSISNAVEAVASFTVDPVLVAGDQIEVNSGWGRLNSRLVRVKTVTGVGPYLVTLEGVNTSDTAKFPPGSGAGTTRKISTWTPITQLKELTGGGGEPKYADITTYDDVNDRQMPSGRGAATIDVEVFDDPALAFYASVVSASDSSTVTGMKISFSNGSSLYANAYWSIQKIPVMAKGQALTSKINASYVSEPIRYAS